MEKQRQEDEEREREETNRINRAISSSNYTNGSTSVSKVKSLRFDIKIRFFCVWFVFKITKVKRVLVAEKD